MDKINKALLEYAKRVKNKPMKLTFSVSGDFMKASIVKQNPIAVYKIVGDIEEQPNKWSDKPKKSVRVEEEESKNEYILNLNNKSLKALAEVLGDETSLWYGKRIILSAQVATLSDGKVVDVVYASPLPTNKQPETKPFPVGKASEINADDLDF